MTVKSHWQHVRAQGIGPGEHPATPPKNKPMGDHVYERARCAVCRKAIYWTPENEGPESIKSFFRF